MLNVDFYRDLTWFRKFLPHSNGVCLFYHQSVHDTIHIDASLQGLGGRGGNCVYKLAIPMGMDNIGIVQFEMLNLYLALQIWAPNCT